MSSISWTDSTGAATLTNGSGIYAIVHHATGACYIGSSTRLGRRFEEHRSKLGRGSHVNKKLQALWNEEGDFAFRVLALLEPTELLSTERRLIRNMRQGASCLNACLGTTNGFRGHRHSVDTRELISKKSKLSARRSPLPIETRLRIAETLRGRTLTPEHVAKMRAAGLGRRHTEETKEKCRQRSLLFRHTPETKEKIRQSKLGKRLSDEHRAKVSAAGRGRKHSAQTIEKMRQSAKRRRRNPQGVFV